MDFASCVGTVMGCKMGLWCLMAGVEQNKILVLALCNLYGLHMLIIACVLHLQLRRVHGVHDCERGSIVRHFSAGACPSVVKEDGVCSLLFPFRILIISCSENCNSFVKPSWGCCPIDASMLYLFSTSGMQMFTTPHYFAVVPYRKRMQPIYAYR